MRRRFLNIEKGIDINNYLTIEALEDNLTACLSINTCEYCIDGDGSWIQISSMTETQSINKGQTLSFRGFLIPYEWQGIGTFTVNKNFNLKGNVMSILFGDAGKDNYSLSGKNCVFYKLFYNCTTLKSVSANFLPATTLEDYCYASMFQNCSSLTTVPALPATTVVDSCYSNMFQDCTSLTTAPELPATTLTSNCYSSMFEGCSKLTTAPALPATTLAAYCYSSMFEGCSKLTTAPALPATTLVSSCYQGMFCGCKALTIAPELPATILETLCYSMMFSGCTNLINAPELPATILKSYCYDGMFNGCSNLNHIKMLATNIPASSCLNTWVYGVASTGTFVKNPNMTSLPTAKDYNYYAGIPSGWTVVNDGEESGVSGKIVNHGVMTISKTLKSFNAKIVFEFPCASTISINVITSLVPAIYGVSEGNAYVQFSGVGEFQSFTFTPTEDDTYIYEIEVKIE